MLIQFHIRHNINTISLTLEFIGIFVLGDIIVFCSPTYCACGCGIKLLPVLMLSMCAKPYSVNYKMNPSINITSQET